MRLWLWKSLITMFKKLKSYITLLALGAVFCTGCSSTSIKYLPPNEFMKQATMLQSVSSSTYIGAGRHRIYLEQENYITFAKFLGFTEKPNYTIYYTDLDKIPLDFFKKLQKRKKNILKKN